MNQKMSKKKILVLGFESTHMVDRTIPLLEYGYQVFIVVPEHFKYFEKLTEFENANPVYLNKEKKELKKSRLQTLKRIIRDINPDMIIVHFCGYVNFHAAIFSNHRPVTGILMGSDINIHNATIPLYVYLELLFTRLFISYIEFLASKSNNITEIVKSLKHRGTCITIPWGIKIPDSDNSTQKAREVLRNKLGIENDAYVIFSPRAMIKIHRIKEIIEAFAAFAGDKSNVYLVILKYSANEEYYEDILETIDNFSIKNKILFLDKIEKSEMPEYYRMSDLIISNSVHDGMPQTLFEAASQESPLLISNLDQYHDFFKAEKDALYSNGEADDITEKLSYAFSKPETMRKLSECAYLAVKEKANIDLWSEVFINEIEALISMRKRIHIPKYKLFAGYIIYMCLVLLRKSPFRRIKIKVN